MTNFDRIKNMTVKEMAGFICSIHDDDCNGELCIDGQWVIDKDVEEWLESEAEE